MRSVWPWNLSVYQECNVPKIIFDPVYTGLPSTCSTSYLVWELIEELSKWRDDYYFYLFYPHEVMDDEYEMEFLRRHTDRVTILPVEAVISDRKRSFWSLASDVYELIAPGLHPGWDAEFVVTSRIPQIPAFKHVSGKAGGWSQNLPRHVFGLEEMPMLSFRETTTAHPEQFDLITYTAYRLSDGVIFNNSWTKKLLMKEGRKHLSPGHLKEMGNKIVEAVPIPLTPLNLRSTHQLEGDFHVVFTGRMTATRRFKDVLRVFTNTFAYDVGGKKKHVRYTISTNSRSAGSSSALDGTTGEFVDLQMNNRASFHKLLHEKAHVVVNLSVVEDFSLSTYEPLLFGIPVIVADKPWSEFLGKDYPFRAASNTEAYALVKEFIHNYEAMYEKFRAWEATTWREVIASALNTTTATHLKEMLVRAEKEIDDWFLEPSTGTRELRGGSYKEEADELVKDRPEFIDLTAHFSELYDERNLRRVAVGKRPTFLMLKRLVMLRGYRDTQQLGVLQRID